MRLTIGKVPLHPALVHIPVACWLAAPILDALAYSGGNDDEWRLASWLSIVGLIVAVPAVVAGLLDAIASRQREDAMASIWLHAGLMATAATCFAIALLFAASHAVTLALHTAGALCMVIGAHQGGRLAYVFRLPAE